MADQNKELGLRANAGKSRPDLIPWHEFHPIATDHGVEVTAEALRMWWAGRPQPLDIAIPQRQLPGIARVLAAGAQKYAERNWEKGQQFSTCFNSAQRHAERVAAGDLIDAELNCANESLFWTNVLFLVVFTARGRTELDDRPGAVPAIAARFRALQTMVDQFNDLARQYGPDGTGPDPEPTPQKDQN